MSQLTLSWNWQITDEEACRIWHRGPGFIVATATDSDANRFIEIAKNIGHNAAIAGEILEEPIIEFRSHRFRY